jgi:hypothetical protein
MEQYYSEEDPYGNNDSRWGEDPASGGEDYYVGEDAREGETLTMPLITFRS